jgi:TPR repeat protein
LWLLVLLVLLIGGGAAAYFLNKNGPPETVAKATGIADMDACRKAVSAQPAASAARVDADALGKESKLLDCQFLLYKYAAEKGDRDAARRMGTFYDPDTWSKDKSPLPQPNPVEAARWHKQAAEAGDVESQYRYGMLLKLGRTDAPDGPEQAVGWLRKAAEAGDERAKAELPK